MSTAPRAGMCSRTILAHARLPSATAQSSSSAQDCPEHSADRAQIEAYRQLEPIRTAGPRRGSLAPLIPCHLTRRWAARRGTFAGSPPLASWCGAATAQVKAEVHVGMPIICKTVGFAFPGSNPGPATTCGNGPWPGVSPGARGPPCANLQDFLPSRSAWSRTLSITWSNGPRA